MPETVGLKALRWPFLIISVRCYIVYRSGHSRRVNRRSDAIHALFHNLLHYLWSLCWCCLWCGSYGHLALLCILLPVLMMMGIDWWEWTIGYLEIFSDHFTIMEVILFIFIHYLWDSYLLFHNQIHRILFMMLLDSMIAWSYWTIPLIWYSPLL